jgi:hypothetical protein
MSFKCLTDGKSSYDNNASESRRPLRFKLGNHKQFMGLGARMSLRSVHLEMAKPAEAY